MMICLIFSQGICLLGFVQSPYYPHWPWHSSLGFCTQSRNYSHLPKRANLRYRCVYTLRCLRFIFSMMISFLLLMPCYSIQPLQQLPACVPWRDLVFPSSHLRCTTLLVMERVILCLQHLPLQLDVQRMSVYFISIIFSDRFLAPSFSGFMARKFGQKVNMLGDSFSSLI